MSQHSGRTITLADVPPEFFAWLSELGFSHVWLMGVWKSGPKALRCARRDTFLKRACAQAFPEDRKAPAASPYAIASYTVPAALGGERGLACFRQELNRRGLQLVLDFVPNHLGLDHPWVRDRPNLFVQSLPKRDGSFRQRSPSGVRWLAHGKDPWFPPWTDTVQLDYRRPETHQAMARLLESVSDRCDGVRCDMAMLVLNDVFRKTWRDFPDNSAASMAEFWPKAIAEVKRRHPRFLFLAEAYWGLEPQLQDLGFDFTYDKTLYDKLVAKDAQGASEHLRAVGLERIKRGVHFLENHDEPRIASLLAPREYRAAMVLVMTLPGMCLLHQGQLDGRRVKAPVQFARWPKESTESESVNSYSNLFRALRRTSVGSGEFEWMRSENSSVFLLKWQTGRQFVLAAINYSSEQAVCSVVLPESSWVCSDALVSTDYSPPQSELKLDSFEARLLHFRPG